MRFTPKTEEEIKHMNLIPEGKYFFEVLEAKDTVSNTSRNPMIALKLRIYDDSGKSYTLFDNLLEAMAYKLRHFADVTGLLPKYETGELTEHDCKGKNGALELIIQKGKADGKGGFYPDKNAVKDYIPITATGLKTVALGNSSVASFPDDDVPF